MRAYCREWGSPWWLIVILGASAVTGWAASRAQPALICWMIALGAVLLLSGLVFWLLASLRLRGLQHKHARFLAEGVADLHRLGRIEILHLRALSWTSAGLILVVLGGLAGFLGGLPVAAAVAVVGLVPAVLLAAGALWQAGAARSAVLAYVAPPDTRPTSRTEALARLSPRWQANAANGRVFAGGEGTEDARRLAALIGHPAAFWPQMARLPGHATRVRLAVFWRGLRHLWREILAAALLAWLMAALVPFPALPPLPSPVSLLLSTAAPEDAQAPEEDPEQEGPAPGATGNDGAGAPAQPEGGESDTTRTGQSEGGSGPGAGTEGSDPADTTSGATGASDDTSEGSSATPSGTDGDRGTEGTSAGEPDGQGSPSPGSDGAEGQAEDGTGSEASGGAGGSAPEQGADPSVPGDAGQNSGDRPEAGTQPEPGEGQGGASGGEGQGGAEGRGTAAEEAGQAGGTGTDPGEQQSAATGEERQGSGTGEQSGSSEDQGPDGAADGEASGSSESQPGQDQGTGSAAGGQDSGATGDVAPEDGDSAEAGEQASGSGSEDTPAEADQGQSAEAEPEGQDGSTEQGPGGGGRGDQAGGAGTPSDAGADPSEGSDTRERPESDGSPGNEDAGSRAGSGDQTGQGAPTEQETGREDGAGSGDASGATGPDPTAAGADDPSTPGTGAEPGADATSDPSPPGAGQPDGQAGPSGGADGGSSGDGTGPATEVEGAPAGPDGTDTAGATRTEGPATEPDAQVDTVPATNIDTDSSATPERDLRFRRLGAPEDSASDDPGIDLSFEAAGWSGAAETAAETRPDVQGFSAPGGMAETLTAAPLTPDDADPIPFQTMQRPEQAVPGWVRALFGPRQGAMP